MKTKKNIIDKANEIVEQINHVHLIMSHPLAQSAILFKKIGMVDSEIAMWTFQILIKKYSKYYKLNKNEIKNIKLKIKEKYG